MKKFKQKQSKKIKRIRKKNYKKQIHILNKKTYTHKTSRQPYFKAKTNL